MTQPGPSSGDARVRSARRRAEAFGERQVRAYLYGGRLSIAVAPQENSTRPQDFAGRRGRARSEDTISEQQDTG